MTTVGDWQAPDWSTEYWPGDPPALMDIEEINRFLYLLADPRDRRDALRTLRGSILRTELYALDGTDRQNRPYTVTEQAFGLREESAPEPGDLPRRRIFFPHPVAQRTTQWERGDEPMTRFAFTDDYDAYGQPRRQVSLAVPRHRDYRLPAPPGAPYLGTLARSRYALRDDAERYVVNRVCESSSFEILNDGSLPSTISTARPKPAAAAPRLWPHVQLLRRRGLRRAAVSDELGEFGALVRSESLVLTEEILRDVYRDPAEPVVATTPPYLAVTGAIDWPADYPKEFRDETPALAGYVFADGSDHRPRGYFAQATRVAFDFQTPDLPPRGLTVARRDPLGNDTVIAFDRYHLLPVQLTDAVGLTTGAEYDYRVLQARTVTDANGNRTVVSFGPLGLVTASAVMGKAGEQAGDTLEAPGSRLEYDLFAFADRQQPVFVRHIAREHHVSDTDVPLPARNATIVTVEYSDGFGRLLQTRTQTDDVLFGAAPFGGDVLPADQSAPSAVWSAGDVRKRARRHVIVSGWQVYDNKGRIVEAYEPFFSAGLGYEPAREELLGRKATMFYDPRGEVIRTLGPDGSEQRVLHGIPADLERSGRVHADALGGLHLRCQRPRSADPRPGWHTARHCRTRLPPLHAIEHRHRCARAHGRRRRAHTRSCERPGRAASDGAGAPHGKQV